ncbi:MAG: Gfo/Idh/MocA family oxidoreductase [Defluviitaleaceae bacterium]|nr:Gfo/Idh/MocA family oxidoreductase [Defluviitaleaceae bacterium]
MKYALVGTGRIAPHHVSAAKANNLSFDALCDADLAKARNFAFKHEINVPCFDNHIKMLDSVRPDVVAIATSSGTHAAIALDCIDAGCHVLIEKPIALSVTDANEIIKRAEKKGVIAYSCHQNRFNKSVQKLKDAVTQGRFGRIFHIAAHVRWNRTKEYYDQAKWRGTWAEDGGCLMNQCIHNIDLLRWVMNSDPVEVFAQTSNFAHPYVEAEDVGVSIVKFACGGIGLVEGTVNVFPKNLEETLYVFGERGTAKLGGTSVNNIEEWLFDDGLDDSSVVKREFSESPPSVYGFGHTPLYRDFIEAVIGNRVPAITAIEGKKSMELILAMYKSSHENVPVKFPINSVSTLDFFDRKW